MVMSGRQRRRPTAGVFAGPRLCDGCGAVLAADNNAPLCGRCLREGHDQLDRPARHGDEFFQTGEFRVAFASQDIGKVFKAYRHHPIHLTLFGKALNQETLGRWIGLTQNQVSRLENGNPEHDIRTLQHYAKILHLPRHMLWFDFPGETRLTVDPASMIQDYPTAVVDESETPSITAIRAMAEGFQIADRKLGGGVLYPQVIRYIRAEIAPSLLDPPPTIAAGDLFSAAASFAEVAGWMAHDSGRNLKAQAHFGQAYYLAGTARNPILTANICASMAHLAIQLGQPEDAIRITNTGLPRANRHHGASHLVARLYAMRARALAVQGKHTECAASLDHARHTLDTSSGASNPEWVAGFDEASLAAESALCFYNLGQLDQAETEARTVIALRVGDRVRSRALGQLTLANILYQAGHIDEAAASDEHNR